jgi:hypothetical protein
MHIPYPQLNSRAQGWPKFMHRKATTADDWSSNGTRVLVMGAMLAREFADSATEARLNQAIER